MPRSSESPSPDGAGPNGGKAWLRDPHFIVAALAALPVWLVLGLAFGDRLRPAVGPGGWISFVLLQPVLEEFVFRGLLQGLLLRWTARAAAGPVTLANIGATVAFVAVHFVYQPIGWALAVAIPSLVFGHLRERFGKVAPAMALHALYNAGFAVTAWLAQH